MHLSGPRTKRLRSIIGLLWLVAVASACAAEPAGDAPARAVDSPAPATRTAPAPGVSAATLGVVVNTRDPDSVALGRHYLEARGIPVANLIEVAFPPKVRSLGEGQFARLRTRLDAATPAHIQAYALAWSLPYKVGCLSMTTAISLGFDPAYCAKGCVGTRQSPYYDVDVDQPWTALGVRPSMLLAGSSPQAARELIATGIAADGTAPTGTAYLLSTSDARRNVRAARYPGAAEAVEGSVSSKIVTGDALRGAQDVMFYFTGGVRIEGIDSNRFLPGAVADHLTSAGGRLDGERQMSILRWLDAGATASYGAVIEPCNFPAKFPEPVVVMRRYAAGETVLEAYWKSVRMPGQGVFVGEPLARPWGTDGR